MICSRGAAPGVAPQRIQPFGAVAPHWTSEKVEVLPIALRRASSMASCMLEEALSLLATSKKRFGEKVSGSGWSLRSAGWAKPGANRALPSLLATTAASQPPAECPIGAVFVA